MSGRAELSIDEVLRRVQQYAPGADTQLVAEAYLYAAMHHRGQIRKNGEDYLIHPLNVALILSDIRMDVETIAVGLLHDTLEDTEASVEDIAKRFGPTVAEMVEGVTKLSKLAYRGKLEEQAENFRKLVLAFGKDIRVIIVKCADRLHNMRTLQFQRADKQVRIARETLDIYAPLTHRLGLELMKRELEDLSFRYLHPAEYQELETALELDAETRERYVAETKALISETLVSRGLNCIVTGRVKHLYSIWKKLQRTEKGLGDLHDLLAFRVMVTERDSCYVGLGFVHSAFFPVATRMKDYIAMPKANGYQSLHTTVVGPDGRDIEIQFRTEAMDRVADTGIAAHWRYKNGRLSVSNAELEELARLRGFIQMARDIEDPSDFLDAARSDLSATIHVFTPAKDVVLLPEGSSALDFAYHVHSEVGNHASGVKVNGRLVPFRTLVKTGDNVEVLTREDAHPTRDWLEWAHSHRALEKIRKRLRESLSDKAVALGRDILDGALRKQGSSLKRVLSDRELAGRLKDAGYEDVDELAGKLLAGSVGPTEAGRILLPQPIEPLPAPSAFQSLLQRVRRPAENAILVSGQTDILVDYARCCRPMKGESIIGYITRGRGLSVHKEECTQLRGLDAERFISVTWDAQSRTLHQGLLHLVLEDRPGMLAAITGVCSTAKINLWRANVRQDEDDRAICDLGVSVYDIGELDGLVKKLKSVRGVVAVERAAAL